MKPGLSPMKKPSVQSFGPGICDFCGEQADALFPFDCAPVAGLGYCAKCAPESPAPNSPAEADFRASLEHAYRGAPPDELPS